MARVEFYLGTTGPHLIDDTHPLYNDPRQLITRGTVLSTIVLKDSGDSGKLCALRPLFMGVDDKEQDIWALVCTTVVPGG